MISIRTIPQRPHHCDVHCFNCYARSILILTSFDAAGCFMGQLLSGTIQERNNSKGCTLGRQVAHWA
ncbi:hypothetical protein ACS0TY_012351 [Phlomoides rotata]